MIRSISSSLSTFKTLEFDAGLNILIAKKEPGASDQQTRNRAGKTSLIEIIHFLTGANVNKGSLFHDKALLNQSFVMDFDLAGIQASVERSLENKSKIHISNEILKRSYSNLEWISILGEQIFEIQETEEPGRSPAFRSLFSYFVRRQISGAFIIPEKQANQQQPVDYQLALMYLLGLDWRIVRDWQIARDREKMLKELKKAARAGEFGNIIGKSADLRTQLTVAESQLNQIKGQVESFQILPQYRELELEADDLTQKINGLANANVLDTALMRDLDLAIKSEAPPPLTELEEIYAEAGIVLPDVIVKRYEEVSSFHHSVIRNRRDYLEEEIELTKQRINMREQEKAPLDQKRAEVMNLLQSHGALEQFSLLQADLARRRAESESLRQRFKAAERLEGTKNELNIERNQLTIRLRRDFDEQYERMDKAILAFEATSERLYESAGSMIINPTTNGPTFSFPMQGSRSKGIKNMQIFCFDMMLMQICAERKISPGFLVHDSHLFDGVDGRQIIHALKAGAEMADEFGFQYIVTINEDDALKETIANFDIKQYMLPVALTDATEGGGLFGIRF